MATIETRAHLGPHEIEIDGPLYGVMLVGNGSPYMTLKVFSDKEKARRHAATFKSVGYVVRISGTNS